MAVYQHQLHSHKTHRPHPWRWIIGICLVIVAAGGYGVYSLKPDTKISQTKAVSKKVSTNSATQTFVKGSFSIDLPKGWQFTSEQQDIYTIFHFKSALPGEAGNRSLDVYQDSNLPNFAVNRMLPVESNGEGGLTTDPSLISDNCTAYTTGATSGRTTAAQAAKWQGVDFLCDLSNTLRNVVGSGSKDGLNTVIVQSATSRPHHYFFTYTENNNNPNYSIFTAAINSFKLIE